jgi:RNA polymerase sigma-70 factor, ECF subfamily
LIVSERSGKAHVEESDLIIRARQGDEAACEALVRQHQEAVFRLAYLLLGDPGDADDVAQETFIHALQALARFDTTRPIRPWLMSITRNLASNRRRAMGRYVAALQRAVRLAPDAILPKTEHSEEAQELWQTVRRLDRNDQEIIYLRYFLEMSEAETAETLGIAHGTVKSRLHRALGRLRAVMETESSALWERGEG